MTVNEFFDALKKGATWSAGVSFKRANPLPLDLYSVFPSYEEANTYATTNAVAYPGQVIAVINEKGSNVYFITEKMELEEVGEHLQFDSKSIALDADGFVSLVGFKDAEKSTLPQKDPETGALKWVTIDSIVKGDGNTKTFGDTKSITTEKYNKDTDTYTASLVGFEGAAPRTVAIKGAGSLEGATDGDLEWTALSKTAFDDAQVEANKTAIEKNTQDIATATAAADKANKAIFTEVSEGKEVNNIATNASNITTLQGQVSALENALNNEGSGINKQISTINATLEEHKTAIDANADTIAENASNIATQGQTIAQQGETLTAHAGTLDTQGKAISALQTKTNDMYSKAEVNEKIAAVDHLHRKIVKTIEEIDLTAPDADKYIYLVPHGEEVNDHYDEYMVINGALEKVGDWTVDLKDYATRKELFNEVSYTDEHQVTHKGTLLTSAQNTKLTGIEDGAQVNKIDTVDAEFNIDGKKLTLVSVGQDKVTGLSDSLKKKVDVVKGSSLMLDSDKTKLDNMLNIKSVTEGELELTEAGNLQVKAIDSGKITGLAASLDKKVDKVDGKGLSTNDYTTAEKDKLAGIDEGAEVNVINAANSSEFTISNDDSRILSVKAIAQSKVTGLEGALSAKLNKDDLNKEVLALRDSNDALLTSAEKEKLTGIAIGAQVNVIEKIKLAGQENGLSIADKTVELPIATAAAVGLVKSSDKENQIAVDGKTGIMEVNSLNVNKLTQSAGDTLIINGGNSNI